MLTWAVSLAATDMAPEPKTDIAQPVGISKQDTASMAHSATLDRILARVSAPGGPRHKKRRAFATSTAVLAACALLFLTLAKVGASFEALPWYITVRIIGVLW